MLREVYMVLKNHLSSSIEELELVDFDLGQYKQEGEDHVLSTPAVYIKFHPINWQQQTWNNQSAPLSFSITLVNETVHGDDRDITSESIGHLSIQKSIYKALEETRFLLSEHPAFEALAGTDQDRVLIETIKRVQTSIHGQISNLIIGTQTFQANIFDYEASPTWQAVLATLDLDVKYKGEDE